MPVSQEKSLWPAVVAVHWRKCLESFHAQFAALKHPVVHRAPRSFQKQISCLSQRHCSWHKSRLFCVVRYLHKYKSSSYFMSNQTWHVFSLWATNNFPHVTFKTSISKFTSLNFDFSKPLSLNPHKSDFFSCVLSLIQMFLPQNSEFVFAVFIWIPSLHLVIPKFFFSEFWNIISES